jgi:PfpI family intracellular protease
MIQGGCKMKRIIRMITAMALTITMLLSLTAMSSAQTVTGKEGQDDMQVKVLLVVAPKDFEDFEVFETKTVLEANGAKVVTASTTKDTAVGSYGRTLAPDLSISDAKAADYDAVVIEGGTGVIEHIWDNKDVHKLIQESNKLGKTIGAICAAPVTLSKAGIMKGVAATMYPWDDGIKELTNGGALYVNDEVVVSGNIITGRNVDATRAFSLRLCDILGIRPTQKKVLMVIAPKDFEDVEVLVPRTILETSGARVTIASTTTGTAVGSQGSQIKPDISIKDAQAKDYDAIVIPGGTGVIGALWDNRDLHKLLQDANKLNLTIASMCAAPPTLSKAGIKIGRAHV